MLQIAKKKPGINKEKHGLDKLTQKHQQFPDIARPFPHRMACSILSEAEPGTV